MKIRLPWLRERPADSTSRYSVRREKNGLRHFTIRGPQPLVTHLLFENLQSLSGQVGIVLVEVEDPPREWAVPALDRTRVAHALMSLRDLLGRGHIDVAVFSHVQGMEIYLDRFGTLEIRTGDWAEPAIRSRLEAHGFRVVARLPVLPSPVEGKAPQSDEQRARLAAVQRRLGMATELAPPGVEGAS